VTEAAKHTPVLTREVLELLDVQSGETVLDATIGLGGHASLFAEAIGPAGTLVGLDVDPANLAVAKERLSGFPCRVELIHANFAECDDALASVGIAGVDVLFADLGVSSTQLDQAERGFSFRHDGPLDMRLDPRLKETAADLVNRLKERELGDLFYYNAQELKSRRIARRICEQRRDGRITTTAQLSRIVVSALRAEDSSRWTKIHPATRVFMALRMAVNSEIQRLEDLLQKAPRMLKPGGRFGVIAFHSVEDKPVKLSFRDGKKDGIYRMVTKKPVIADQEERSGNPRSRSAKLRVVVRFPQANDGLTA